MFLNYIFNVCTGGRIYLEHVTWSHGHTLKVFCTRDIKNLFRTE
jgi:hypothetical protein